MSYKGGSVSGGRNEIEHRYAHFRIGCLSGCVIIVTSSFGTISYDIDLGNGHLWLQRPMIHWVSWSQRGERMRQKQKIELVVHIRKDASTSSRGSGAIIAQVRERNATGEDGRRRKYSQNERWGAGSAISDLTMMIGWYICSWTVGNTVGRTSRIKEYFNRPKRVTA